jgi:hypothetical protein
MIPDSVFGHWHIQGGKFLFPQVYIQYHEFVARLRYQFDKRVYQCSRLLERSIICRSWL